MSMTPDEIKDLLEQITMTAMGQLVQDGELQPVLIAFAGEKQYISPLTMADERDKDALALAIPSFIEEIKADAAFMVTDAWLKDPTNTHRIGEILSVVCAAPSGLTSKCIKYTRDADGKPVFEEPEAAEVTHIESRFFQNINWRNDHDNHEMRASSGRNNRGGTLLH